LTPIFRRFGICFREHGFLPGDAGGGTSFVSLGRESASFRKGHIGYAKQLCAAIGNPRLKEFDLIVVAGDSLGDYRFFTNLVDQLAKCGFTGCVEGHLITQPEHVRPNSIYQGLHWHRNWEDLTSLLSNAIRGSLCPLVFVDIDRTVIFPRGTHDDEYSATRHRTLKEYVVGFCQSELSDVELSRIDEIIVYASEHFIDYFRNELAVDCFKNEETVAAVALMLSVGVVKKAEIAGPAKLRTLAAQALFHAKQGGWISGVYADVDGFDRCSGQKVWNKKLCAEQFARLDEALRNDQAVFLPEFRVVEAGILSEFLMDGRIPWNLGLLQTLASCDAAMIVFMTDKPTISLGEPSDPPTPVDLLGEFVRVMCSGGSVSVAGT